MIFYKAGYSLYRNPSAQTVYSNECTYETVGSQPDLEFGPEDQLGNLKRLKIEADLARQALDTAVVQVHDGGVSWSRIAKALGKTTSQVSLRWDPERKRRHNESLKIKRSNKS